MDEWMYAVLGGEGGAGRDKLDMWGWELDIGIWLREFFKIMIYDMDIRGADR